MADAARTIPDAGTTGLTSHQARNLLRVHGFNQLPDIGTVRSIAIVGVVIINGVFAYVQEERAEHGAAKLRALLPVQVLVRRDGKPTRVPAGNWSRAT